MQGYIDNSPPSSPPLNVAAAPRRSGPSVSPFFEKDNNERKAVPPSHVFDTVNTTEKGILDKGKGKEGDVETPVQIPKRPKSTSESVQRELFRPTDEAGPSRIPSPHVAPVVAPAPPLEGDDVSDPFEGLTEEEIFRLVTRPGDIEGVENWGIPPAVDPNRAPDALKAKVEHFLKLKYERGQHINTTLLSSSSFANPHIYSKLVEFVDIDETATAFPSEGWMTRRHIESLIPEYGPKALAAVQKAKQDAVKRSQETGKRSTIQFAPGRRRDGDDRGSQPGSAKKRYRDEEYRDKPRDKERDGRRRDGRQYEGDDRNRDRDRRERR